MWLQRGCWPFGGWWCGAEGFRRLLKDRRRDTVRVEDICELVRKFNHWSDPAVDRKAFPKQKIFLNCLQGPGRIIWWCCLLWCIRSHRKILGSCFPGVPQGNCLFCSQQDLVQRENQGGRKQHRTGRLWMAPWPWGKWENSLSDLNKLQEQLDTLKKNKQTCAVQDKGKQYIVVSQAMELFW